MKKLKKVTVLLPEDLIKRATDASGDGLTPTLRKGLELVAAKDVYRQLYDLKGKFTLNLDIDVSREDKEK